MGMQVPPPALDSPASLTAAVGVQDLGSVRVNADVDTNAATTGILIGIGLLFAIRLYWELADE